MILARWLIHHRARLCCVTSRPQNLMGYNKRCFVTHATCPQRSANGPLYCTHPGTQADWGSIGTTTYFTPLVVSFFPETSVSVCLVHSLLLRAQHAKSIQPQLLNKWMLNTSVSHNHPSSPRASQESSFPTPGLFFPSPLWTPLVVPFSNHRPRLHREAFSDYLRDVNFMCQRDWVWDTQIFCPTLFWKCVCEGVLDESNSWIGRMNKADCPPQCGWASSNQLRAWTEQKLN